MSVTAVSVEGEAPQRKGALAVLGGLWAGPVGKALRVALMVLPLLWLYRSVAWREVLANAGYVGVKGIALATMFLMLSIVFGAIRWRELLLAYGAQRDKLPSLWSLYRGYLVGLYFNVLPSGVAGDAVRGFRVKDAVKDATTSYVVLLMERLGGLLGLLLIAGVATIGTGAATSGPLSFAFSVGAVGALGVSVLAFLLPQWCAKSERARALVSKIPVLGKWMAALPAAQSMRGPILSLLLSVLTQGMVLLCVASLVAPLSPAATLAVCARVVPAIVLVTYIPLTPGGLGQREAAFVHFFGTAGVGREAAVTASLLYFAVVIALSLLGGAVFFLEQRAAAQKTT